MIHSASLVLTTNDLVFEAVTGGSFNPTRSNGWEIDLLNRQGVEEFSLGLSPGAPTIDPGKGSLPGNDDGLGGDFLKPGSFTYHAASDSSTTEQVVPRSDLPGLVTPLYWVAESAVDNVGDSLASGIAHYGVCPGKALPVYWALFKGTSPSPSASEIRKAYADLP